tara:strand:- start:3931 stop:4365 length:435 start_codon:yes stop_codon:yes gene_type:complete
MKRRPISRKQIGDTDPLLLLFLIVVGVTSGNLLSNWITAQYVAYQTELAAQEFSRKASAARERAESENRERQAAARAADYQRQQQSRQLRASSQLGKRLIRECEEWWNAANANSSKAARAEANRRCRKKDQYLDRGVWDPSLGK